MIGKHYLENPWKIIEHGWSPENVKSSESLFSIGNGAMGQRANFEEDYSGSSFQGSYIGGVYYPDKTRVGWWKNGYPEYFAKVLNAPNWIGIHIKVNGQVLDLNRCKTITNYERVLDMQAGTYSRTFRCTLQDETVLQIESLRFLSLDQINLGAIRYTVKVIQGTAALEISPYLDAGIKNQDSNWEDQFWQIDALSTEADRAFILSHTLKTKFHVCTYMETQLWSEGKLLNIPAKATEVEHKTTLTYTLPLSENNSVTLIKYGGYVSDRNYPKEHLKQQAQKELEKASEVGFDVLLEKHTNEWAKIWERADIQIGGDVKAQQAIRFNIFQLNQTYTGNDAGLNIGPKGFTGEKYGGSTYWDTEAYCIPFYMATKKQEVARNLLAYRYQQLDRAIENAVKLGFTSGAALYPMVTMNGEECHNEWEITFEEIHRNGAIAFAIFNYERYTADTSYIPEMGLEVLIGISRFWAQRFNFSKDKNAYVMLGVTGPNEYENNINNNWYTNYIAQWCLEYTAKQVARIRNEFPNDYKRITAKTKIDTVEVEQWKNMASQIYFPYDDDKQVFLQQDGFLDKELTPVVDLNTSERPINQHWSWDRILRSPYIKQADVLQGFYLFENQFDLKTLERNYDFYEPLTVHESSLSPCVHSILASRLGKEEQAYAFYLRTARLDLDDYNAEVEEGLHITSMAGTWMSIVEGFAGMRIVDDQLSFRPRLPKAWDDLEFRINFRDVILSVTITHTTIAFSTKSNDPIRLMVDDVAHEIAGSSVLSI